MAGLLDSIKNTVSEAADSVSSAVGGFVDGALLKAAEKSIKEETGMDIDLEMGSVPDSKKDWMRKTGINSIACSGTWRFLDNSSYNARKVEKWKQRGIKKIILSAKDEVDPEDRWIVCLPKWETGSTTLELTFYPRAYYWSSNNTWVEPGHKSYWYLDDEIVSGLQLYQLPGKCFYKSDFLDGFEDVDPNSVLPFGTAKFKRWFQFRHWIIYWYPNEMWGYNWAYTTKPPSLPDGSDFNLDSILSCPSLPDFEMPKIKLPSLPNIEMPSMPDMPSLPDVSLPDAPSLSAPSLSAPSLGSLPSIPDKPKRPSGKWACHGFIELRDLKVKADGKDVILSNANLTNFWEKNGHIDTEQKDRQRLVLKATDEEQAESWKLSLMESGVEEGDAGGCCTVA